MKEVEEAIKRLDVLCDFGLRTILDKEQIEDIDTVLGYVKELEADNYASNNIINEQIDLLKDSIPKQVIRDKIEELEKDKRFYECFPEDYMAEICINILKELLEEE